jgi:hypothetical protein
MGINLSPSITVIGEAAMPNGPGKWTPADATKRINGCARNSSLSLAYSRHATERLSERNLIMGDLLHLLKTGFVYEEPEPSTREGHFKYRIEGTTPNSDGRTLRAVVVPGTGCELKIVTIMWRDEK